MVCLVYPHSPPFLRPPTVLPASRTSISLLDTEVASPNFSQRLAAGTRPLAFPPSISTSPDLLRPAPSRCWFYARFNSSLPLPPLQHLPSLRTTLPRSPSLRSPVGLLLLCAGHLFPADFCAVSLCPQTQTLNARHITMHPRANSSTTSLRYGSLPHCSRMTPQAKPCGQRSQVAFRI